MDVKENNGRIILVEMLGKMVGNCTENKASFVYK